jgi:hypothetical protein
MTISQEGDAYVARDEEGGWMGEIRFQEHGDGIFCYGARTKEGKGAVYAYLASRIVKDHGHRTIVCHTDLGEVGERVVRILARFGGEVTGVVMTRKPKEN